VAGWRDFEHRLHTAAPSPLRRFQTLLPSIAAALLVATVGLGTRVWQLQDELNRPVANLRSLQLSQMRAGTGPAAEIASGDPLRLVIQPVVRCPGYEAVLEGPKRGDRRTVQGLKPDDRGLLNLMLRLDPGSYSLQLYGCEPRQEAGNYRFTVKPNGDTPRTPGTQEEP